MTPRRLTPFLGAILLLIIATSCADNDDGRRFATDPLPSGERPTAAPSPVLPTPTPVVVPPALSPEALLRTRDAPRRIYFRSGAELWTMDATASDARRLLAPEDGEIRDFAPSPGGDRVAVLLASQADADDTETTSLRIISVEGQEIRREDDVQAALGPAAVGSRATALSWSPDGDRILVAFATGGLVRVPQDGPPILLIDPAGAAAPGDAAWSPTGDAIAYLDPVGTDARAALRVARAGAPPLDPVSLPTSTGAEDRSVTGLAWLPDGSGILFAETAAPGSPATGGDLFAVAPSGKDLRLVASTGFAAPIAEVGPFAPSPDGEAVAYAVFLPTSAGGGAGTLTFHSLWVRPLAGGAAHRLAVAPGATVTDLWWTAAGLVVRVVPSEPGLTAYDGGPFALDLYADLGEAMRIHAAEPAAAATPVASPIASPIATPKASPPAE